MNFYYIVRQAIFNHINHLAFVTTVQGTLHELNISMSSKDLLKKIFFFGWGRFKKQVPVRSTSCRSKTCLVVGELALTLQEALYLIYNMAESVPAYSMYSDP